jgi:hypothetical protein
MRKPNKAICLSKIWPEESTLKILEGQILVSAKSCRRFDSVTSSPKPSTQSPRGLFLKAFGFVPHRGQCTREQSYRVQNGFDNDRELDRGV